MTELTTFLVAVYDAISEAETTAFRHGQDRLAELLAGEGVPQDVTVPVYHATNLNVSLAASLEVVDSDGDTEVRLVERPPEDDAGLSFDLEVFDSVERRDLTDIGIDDIVTDLPEDLTDFPQDLPDDIVTETPDDVIEDQPDGEDGGDDDGAGTDDGEDGGDDDGGATDDGIDDDTHGGDEGGHGPVVDRPVEAVEGIGQSVASVLREAGVETVPDLLDRSTSALAETVVEVSDDFTAEDAHERIERAREEAVAEADDLAAEPVDAIEGIGPRYGARLRAAGIETVGALAEASPDTVAEVASGDDARVRSDRARRWVERARERVGQTDADADSSTENGGAGP